MSDKCPACGEFLVMMIRNIPMLVDIDTWNANVLMTDMIKDFDGNPIPNCNRCGKAKRTKNENQNQ